MAVIYFLFIILYFAINRTCKKNDIIEMHEKRREVYADIRLFVRNNCKFSLFPRLEKRDINVKDKHNFFFKSAMHLHQLS